MLSHSESQMGENFNAQSEEPGVYRDNSDAGEVASVA